MKKILIANRGEIAVRIIKTCRKMAIRTVAVYSEADTLAPFVQDADEAICIGKASAQESYLNIEKIIQAAQNTQADAIHPGYGFLSENADFAQKCQEAGILLIAPSPTVMRQMGSKIEAKNLMAQHQIPTIEGYNGTEQTLEKLQTEAQKIGFPLLIKASASGGGKGMKIVRTAQELEYAIESAKREALQSFGDDKVLLEKYFEDVRHIEFQIVGDNLGNVVHLFERECSIQRRHQKIIEEAPSPTLSEQLRQKMGETAVKIGQLIGYTNAGTIEFLVDKEDNFYFLEVNTRLQVEHPVTECITGLDLVALQIEIAQGNPLPFKQEDIRRNEHAIELRLYAENPAKDFAPSTGKILKWETPDFIRSDSGVDKDSEVSSHYDNMLAKLIIEGKNRADAIRKSSYALEELCCLGIETNQTFLKSILQHPNFEQGNISTDFLEKNTELWNHLNPSIDEIQQAVWAVSLMRWSKRKKEQKILPKLQSGWRNNPYSLQTETYLFQNEKIELSYRVIDNQYFQFQMDNLPLFTIQVIQISENEVRYSKENRQYRIILANNENEYFVQISSKQLIFRALPRIAEPTPPSLTGSYKAPMPGEITKVWITQGQAVEAGAPLLVINSMKMENTIFAHSKGIVKEIFVQEKMSIKADKLLLRIEDEGF